MAATPLDILVIGGGMVGACLAALAASNRHFSDLRIAVLEAQPPGMPEKPCVREFSDSKVELHLVEGNVETLAERSHILRHEGRFVFEEGNADIAAGYHLGRQLPDHLA